LLSKLNTYGPRFFFGRRPDATEAFEDLKHMAKLAGFSLGCLALLYNEHRRNPHEHFKQIGLEAKKRKEMSELAGQMPKKP